MKKIFTLALVSSFVVFFAGTHNASGPPPGRTGSPGDGNSTCATCHSGGTSVGKSVTLSTNIPASGYVVNTNYTFTVTATGTANKYGFQACVENSVNQKRGTYIGGAQVNVNATDYVNQNANGNTGSGGSKTWTFTWKAPATSSGALKFYAAVNFANGDGGTGGDFISTKNLSLTENVAAPITLLNFNAKKLGEQQVHLTWQTATEHAVDRFEVERQSAQGIWEAVGSVKASGESTVLSSYTLKDNQPLSGQNYYRLKTVNADQSVELSKVVGLRMNGLSVVNVAINGNNAKVLIPQEYEGASLRVYSISGQVLANYEEVPSGEFSVAKQWSSSEMVLFKLEKAEQSSIVKTFF